MTRSPWLTPIAALLVFVMLLTGCVVTRPRPRSDGPPEAVPTSRDAPEQAHWHHGGDARAALFVFGLILFAAVVVVDVIILPATAPCGRPFCCTQEIIIVCYD